jgi:hypothetical protein
MITFKEKILVGLILLRYILPVRQIKKIDSFFIVKSNYKPLDEVIQPDFLILLIILILLLRKHLSFYFEQLVYDEYKDFIIVFLQKICLKKQRGLLNTLKDKQNGLTIIDKNLKVIGDALWEEKNRLLVAKFNRFIGYVYFR